MERFNDDFMKLVEGVETELSRGQKKRLNRKEAFHEYLRRSGVEESLTNALRHLFEQYDQPDRHINPIQLLCDNIGTPRMSVAGYKQLTEELNSKRQRIQELEEEITKLKNRSFSEDLDDKSSISLTSDTD